LEQLLPEDHVLKRWFSGRVFMIECWLSLDEIAAHLGVNPDTIYKWIPTEEHARAALRLVVMNLVLHGTEAIPTSSTARPSTTPADSPHTTTYIVSAAFRTSTTISHSMETLMAAKR
jgi:hypothetical protein